MVASSASVSNEHLAVPRRVLVVSPGWVGDALMSMPALQLFREQHPETEVSVLAKSGLLPLWEMHAVAQHRLALAGTFSTVMRLWRGRYLTAYLFPNSVRSALLPWLAAVPERVGLAGHWRRGLLTRVVTPPTEETRRHQAWEYAAILSPVLGTSALPALHIEPPAAARGATAQCAMDWPRPLIGILPGAARGPAKRWPAECFAEVAKSLREQTSGSIVVMGSVDDAETCARVAAGVGLGARNLAGATNLPEWAAWLALCDMVICNDSGGMHLAAAVGTPVVAIFGLTDPTRTGPLGQSCRLMQHSGTKARAVLRDSREATAALAAVSVSEVLAAARELMQGGERHA